jgi:hypothetical protein
MPTTYDEPVARKKRQEESSGAQEDTIDYLPGISPEKNALRFAVWERMRAKHGTARGWQAKAAEDIGIKAETLSRMLKRGTDMGPQTLEALAAVAPAEVAVILGLSDDARPKRDLWPNLAELIGQIQGNVPPAVIIHAHRLNELWEHDREIGAWLDDLDRWRKDHGL